MALTNYTASFPSMNYDFTSGIGKSMQLYNLKIDMLDITGSYITNTAGVSAQDSTPIQITNFSPNSGSIISRTSVISFDATDNIGLSSIRRVVIHLSFPNLTGSMTGSEVVHDGTSFNSKLYSGSSNIRTNISNGYTYSILRDTGWLSKFTITAFAIDTSGNENV